MDNCFSYESSHSLVDFINILQQHDSLLYDVIHKILFLNSSQAKHQGQVTARSDLACSFEVLSGEGSLWLSTMDLHYIRKTEFTNDLCLCSLCLW